MAHRRTADVPTLRIAVDDIVANARRFRARWGRWPMEGWLTAFAREGLVRWDPSGDLLEPAGTATAR